MLFCINKCWPLQDEIETLSKSKTSNMKSLKFQVQTSKLYAVDLLLHYFLKTLVKTHQCGMLCSWVNIQVFSDATWAQMCCYNSNPILPLLLAPAKSRAIKNKDLLYSAMCSNYVCTMYVLCECVCVWIEVGQQD